MTGLVGRAEKRGLVRRAPSPYDGRAVLVSLTDEGRRAAAEGEAEIGRQVLALTGHLTPAARATLTELAWSVVRGQTP
ncbi:hypothetical protein ABT369_36530 [Dactylosporangium sp. NPDC000244]|uniref:MarR family winged helix-turn-helix transcriptional regulator n=1 Tax=Dactylosporangium sp. NPDC000244 TaxID=3154365 RepID=UPI00332A0EA5